MTVILYISTDYLYDFLNNQCFVWAYGDKRQGCAKIQIDHTEFKIDPEIDSGVGAIQIQYTTRRK